MKSWRTRALDKRRRRRARARRDWLHGGLDEPLYSAARVFYAAREWAYFAFPPLDEDGRPKRTRVYVRLARLLVYHRRPYYCAVAERRRTWPAVSFRVAVHKYVKG